MDTIAHSGGNGIGAGQSSPVQSLIRMHLRALDYRAKELDLKLPLFESIMPSNEEHLERAVDLVLEIGKRKIGMLGLSFKAATDDLRESPQVQLVKWLLGEGREIQIWDDNVSLGRLIGSNRDYIEHVIPHIGSLSKNKFGGSSEGCRSRGDWHARPRSERSAESIRLNQVVIDLVNLEKARRLQSTAAYKGICW